VTIQWDLSDAEPWFLRIDNGATAVEQGRLEEPDLTFSCRFQDLVDIATGREDPRRAIARRRLRPKGSLRLLWRTQKLLPG
jgi:putative sterol carrier protein